MNTCFFGNQAQAISSVFKIYSLWQETGETQRKTSPLGTLLWPQEHGCPGGRTCLKISDEYILKS